MQTRNRRQPQETQEQRAEREAEQARIRAERARLEAERRSEQVRQNLAWLNEVRALAQTLAQRKQDATVSFAEESVLNDIGNGWLAAQAAIETASTELVFNPESFFECSAEHMKNAAKRRFYDAMLADIQKHGAEVKLSKIVAHHIAVVSSALLENRWTSNSTSAAHNAMQLYKAAAHAEMLHELKAWARTLEH